MELIRRVLSYNLERLQGKKTQVEVSRACGIEPQTYNRWVKGKAWPDPESVQAIATYYNCDPGELYKPIPGSESKEARPLSSLASVIIRKMACIPDDVYDLAEKIGSNEKAWADIKSTMGAYVPEAKERKA